MGHTSNLDVFLNYHKEQLVSSGVPEHLWNTLNTKIENQIFDAGEVFQLMQIDYEEERKPHEPVWALQLISSLRKNDPKAVYLIDHAWTFRVNHARKQLREVESLRNRLCNILGLEGSDDVEQLTEDIFNSMWKISRMYSIGNAGNVEDCLPIWYIMDEIGSAVMHSDNPNCRVVPFFHINSQTTYSLLFPVNDIHQQEFIYVDFAEGVTGDLRAASLIPWVPHTFEEAGFLPKNQGPEYYLSGHIRESLPNLEKLAKVIKKSKYKVYAEYSFVKDFLKRDQFELVEEEEEADILWLLRHFKDFEALSETPEKFVNQFPFEYVITIKDLLALTCRKFLQAENMDDLRWLPITYNLKTEIANFINYFQYRDLNHLDNYWIVKPYNLARSLDIHITNNLNYIVRLIATGPKIIQKYITNPVLFYRPEVEGLVKFDVRYVILLKSVKPIKAFVYKEFFLRFANKPFELRNFDDYEMHFTVMNYEKDVTMRHILCSEFKGLWEEQYPDHIWVNVQKSILSMFRDVLECAVKEEPPCGIAHNPQSRAVYAADVMLEWNEERSIQPKLLEINWSPDCKRACEYYKSFYNDIFGVLFLDEHSENVIEL